MIFVGACVRLAGVYREVPAWLGVGGVVVLFTGGLWVLRRNGLQRRGAAETCWRAFDGAPPTLGDISSGHHHGAIVAVASTAAASSTAVAVMAAATADPQCRVSGRNARRAVAALDRLGNRDPAMRSSNAETIRAV